MESKKEIKAWREVKKSQKFLNAFRGLYVFWKTTKNLYFHILVAVLVIFLGFVLKVNSLEWIALIFAIGLVIISEAFNTAIEIDIDLTSPEYHPFARDTKDVAAGAVFLSVVVAVVVGGIVFIPKLLYYINI